MHFKLSFRTIWKINALLILVAGAGLCATLAYAAFQFVINRNATFHREETAYTARDVVTQGSLGDFQAIPGANYMFAPVYSKQPYSIGSIDKEASAIRKNVLSEIDVPRRAVLGSNELPNLGS